MCEIAQIIDDLSIAALEQSTKIASAAVVSDAGELIQQTANWNLADQTGVILNVMKGALSFKLNNYGFTVNSSTSEGIIATNDIGMGFTLFVPFQGGILVSYAMPGANQTRVLEFLVRFARRLDGKV